VVQTGVHNKSKMVDGRHLENRKCTSLWRQKTHESDKNWHLGIGSCRL